MKKLTSILITAILLLSLVSASDWQWIQIGELKPGDSLMDANGNEVIIESIEHIHAPEGVMVYDLEIANTHYYFAEGVLVHNSQAGPQTQPITTTPTNEDRIRAIEIIQTQQKRNEAQAKFNTEAAKGASANTNTLRDLQEEISEAETRLRELQGPTSPIPTPAPTGTYTERIRQVQIIQAQETIREKQEAFNTEAAKGASANAKTLRGLQEEISAANTRLRQLQGGGAQPQAPAPTGTYTERIRQVQIIQAQETIREKQEAFEQEIAKGANAKVSTLQKLQEDIEAARTSLTQLQNQQTQIVGAPGATGTRPTIVDNLPLKTGMDWIRPDEPEYANLEAALKQAFTAYDDTKTVEENLRAYQAARGLSIDGKAGESTIPRINSDLETRRVILRAGGVLQPGPVFNPTSAKATTVRNLVSQVPLTIDGNSAIDQFGNRYTKLGTEWHVATPAAAPTPPSLPATATATDVANFRLQMEIFQQKLNAFGTNTETQTAYADLQRKAAAWAARPGDAGLRAQFNGAVVDLNNRLTRIQARSLDINGQLANLDSSDPIKREEAQRFLRERQDTTSLTKLRDQAKTGSAGATELLAHFALQGGPRSEAYQLMQQGGTYTYTIEVDGTQTQVTIDMATFRTAMGYVAEVRRQDVAGGDNNLANQLAYDPISNRLYDTSNNRFVKTNEVKFITRTGRVELQHETTGPTMIGGRPGQLGYLDQRRKELENLGWKIDPTTNIITSPSGHTYGVWGVTNLEGGFPVESAKSNPNTINIGGRDIPKLEGHEVKIGGETYAVYQTTDGDLYTNRISGGQPKKLDQTDSVTVTERKGEVDIISTYKVTSLHRLDTSDPKITLKSTTDHSRQIELTSEEFKQLGIRKGDSLTISSTGTHILEIRNSKGQLQKRANKQETRTLGVRGHTVTLSIESGFDEQGKPTRRRDLITGTDLQGNLKKGERDLRMQNGVDMDGDDKLSDEEKTLTLVTSDVQTLELKDPTTKEVINNLRIETEHKIGKTTANPTLRDLETKVSVTDQTGRPAGYGEDLNEDGFVTPDEMVGLDRNGITQTGTQSAARKSKAGLIDHLNKITAQFDSRKWYSDWEMRLTQFQGLSGWSQLLLPDELVGKWREGVDKVFSTLYLGSEYWQSPLCGWLGFEVPKDLESSGTLTMQTPDGMFHVLAHAEGEKTTIDLPDGSKQYIYKLTYYVRNAEGSGQEEMHFNVYLKGDATVPLYDEQIKLDDGDSFSRGQGKPEDGQPTFDDEHQPPVIQYSYTNYDQICIKFDNEITTGDGEKEDQICNTIVAASGPPTRVQPQPGTPGTPGGAPDEPSPGGETDF